jgi:DNA-binding CsgD family transcriptional regulator
MMPYSKSLMDALDRLRCGGVVLDKEGQVIELNRTAHQLLRQELGTTTRSEEDADWIASAFKRLRLRASRSSRINGSGWLMTNRRVKQPLAVHLIPFSEEGSPDRAAIMVDLSVAPEPNPAVLQRVFDLTQAEASLAVNISRGETPGAIARNNGVTISTIRSQLASIFAKTNTQRQAELVALLARVSLLPEF